MTKIEINLVAILPPRGKFKPKKPVRQTGKKQHFSQTPSVFRLVRQMGEKLYLGTEKTV